MPENNDFVDAIDYAMQIGVDPTSLGPSLLEDVHESFSTARIAMNHERARQERYQNAFQEAFMATVRDNDISIYDALASPEEESPMDVVEDNQPTLMGVDVGTAPDAMAVLGINVADGPSANEGDVWFDSESNELRMFINGEVVPLSGAGIAVDPAAGTITGTDLITENRPWDRDDLEGLRLETGMSLQDAEAHLLGLQQRDIVSRTTLLRQMGLTEADMNNADFAFGPLGAGRTIGPNQITLHAAEGDYLEVDANSIDFSTAVAATPNSLFGLGSSQAEGPPTLSEVKSSLDRFDHKTDLGHGMARFLQHVSENSNPIRKLIIPREIEMDPQRRNELEKELEDDLSAFCIRTVSIEDGWAARYEWEMDLFIIEHRVNGVLDGPIVRYRSFDCQVHSAGMTKNGKWFGQWFVYGTGDKIEMKGSYGDDGEKTGVWTEYYRGSDLVRCTGTYKHGKADGVFKSFLENGNVTMEVSIVGEDDHGWCIHYNRDGKMTSQGSCKGSSHEGLWTYYDDNGKGMFLVEYKDDAKINTTKLDGGVPYKRKKI